MTPTQAAAGIIPTAGRVMQDALADAICEWIADNAPEELIEQVGAADDAVCQRNDARRKELVA